MGTISLHLDPWSLACRTLWQKLAPRCGFRDCIRSSVWRRLRHTPPRILIHGLRYCADGCLERALAEALPRTQSTPRRAADSHRIPLGLLLLSRQQLTAEQLRAALTAQRTAGHGKIGEWLQTLGFVSQQQVTAALARQWSCPVLRKDSLPPTPLRGPQVPLALLESFFMIPVAYVEPTSTLHIAFGERIDYGVLYALEQMLQCHTEPCLAEPSLLRQRLQALPEHRGEREILFDRVSDMSEFFRIVQSYCLRVSALEIRLATCGRYVWVRLLCRAGRIFDLLLCSPREADTTLPASHFALQM
jgi:hypothetical protein